MRARRAQRELLNDASPSGAVADGVVERLTLRWEARRSDEAAAAAAASNALLAKYAADAAAQRCVRRCSSGRSHARVVAQACRAAPTVWLTRRQLQPAVCARRRCATPRSQRVCVLHRCERAVAPAQEAVLDKRQFLAQLDAVDASSEEEPEEEDEEDDVGGGAARGATSQEVQRAREAMQRAALERREAINRATEREERKRAEHEARRAVREQAGHTNSKPGGRGRAGADGKGDTKRRGCA